MLASRGQLIEVPKEYTSLLVYFKFMGIDIELEKEFLNNLILEDILGKSEKGVAENRKALIKLIYPDHKDEKESLIQEAQRKLTGGDAIMKMRVKKEQQLSVEQVNRLLKGE